MNILSNIPLILEPDKIAAKLHFPGNDESIHNKISEIVELCRKVSKPKAFFKVCYIESRGFASVKIDNVKFKSRILRKNLEKTERVFPYVATCGTELAKMEIRDDDFITPYILDVIKEMALSCAYDYLKDHIKKKYQPGQLSSMSPGSLKDWPIEQQNELFSLLGNVEEQIGVKLTDSLLMDPVKSVSGVFFPTEINFESCQLCPRENCRSRRKEYDPQLAAEYEK